MANTLQAKKRIRRNDRRAEVNGARRSRIRGFIKKVETACTEGDKEAAQTALKTAQPEIARGVAKGVLNDLEAQSLREAMELTAEVTAVDSFGTSRSGADKGATARPDAVGAT